MRAKFTIPKRKQRNMDVPAMRERSGGGRHDDKRRKVNDRLAKQESRSVI